jgi:hypothetical protein
MKVYILSLLLIVSALVVSAYRVHDIRSGKREELVKQALSPTETQRRAESAIKIRPVLAPVTSDLGIQNALARYAITRERDELFNLFKHDPKNMIAALTDSGHFDLIGYFQGIMLKDDALAWFDDNLDSRQKNRAFLGYAEYLSKFDQKAAVEFLQGLDMGTTRDVATQLILGEISKSSPQTAWDVFVSEYDGIQESSGSTFSVVATTIIGAMLNNLSKEHFLEFIRSDDIKMLDPSFMVDISALMGPKYPKQAIEFLENIENNQHLDNAIALMGGDFFEKGNNQSIGLLIDRMKDRISGEQIISNVCEFYFFDGVDSGINKLSSNKQTEYDYLMFKTASGFVSHEKRMMWINGLEPGARRDGLIDGVIESVRSSKEGDVSELKSELSDPTVVDRVIEGVQQQVK